MHTCSFAVLISCFAYCSAALYSCAALRWFLASFDRAYLAQDRMSIACESKSLLARCSHIVGVIELCHSHAGSPTSPERAAGLPGPAVGPRSALISLGIAGISRFVSSDNLKTQVVSTVRYVTKGQGIRGLVFAGLSVNQPCRTNPPSPWVTPCRQRFPVHRSNQKVDSHLLIQEPPQW